MREVYYVLMIALLFLIVPAAWAGVEEFNGRWNLAVPNEARSRAWWLEVSGAGSGKLAGRFVGAPGGQMDTVPEIKIEGSELVWVFERNYIGQPKQAASRGVYRARLVDGGLTGHFMVEGKPESKLEFKGKRAPVIKDVDDGKWKAAAPVELFNGRDMSGWRSQFPGRPLEWYMDNGSLKNRDRAGDIVSSAKFWNFRLHIEYRVADKSNSGIGLRGRYEVQIYGDHGQPPSGHGNGALYSRIVPAVNATLPAKEWQVFDITLIGRQLTVVLNGKTLIDKREIEGPTAMSTDPHEDQPGPISLQGDHGPVEFRKITVTPLVR